MLAILWVVAADVSARALDPDPAAAGDFLRTHFTTDGGLPNAIIDQAEQTKDGFLWVVAAGSYLYRFDGKSFYSFEKPRATTLAVAPDGDLWVGTTKELVRIPSSSFTQFTLDGLSSYHPGPGDASNITCLRFSRSGVLWVGTKGGLFRYEGGQFAAVGPRVRTRQIAEAPDGNILLTTFEGFIEFAGSEVVPHPRLAEQLGVKDNEIFDVLRDRRGNTWYGTAMGVARETNGRIERLGTYARMRHAAYRLHEDARGTVWIGKDEGLFRATPAGLELVAAGMQVRSLYSDRDGNLWVSTNGDGLYRFKERAVRMFTKEDGLPNELVMSVLVAHDGAVWAGMNCGGVSRFDGKHFQTFNEKNGLLNSCVWSLAEDADRDLWIGTWGGGAFRYHGGKFTQYLKGQGMGDDVVVGIVRGRDGSMWFGTHGGLTRLRGGQFRTFTTDDGLARNSVWRVFEDRDGTIWVGSLQGLHRMVGERFENFAAVAQTLAVPFGHDREGAFYVESELDSQAATRRFHKARADVFVELPAYDMVETEQGELWLAATPIIRVLPGAFAHPRQRDDPLDYETFSTADGLATANTTGTGYRSLALGRDGKLWAATPKGLAMFDLRLLTVTNAKPSIYLTDVTIGRTKRHADGDIVLPPGTNHVEIDFAAVEISSPEKIRMQYRLDSVDSEWLDAGTNPRAIYSNMPVGTHALHIRACNRNGIWDRQGVIFSITQQPYFYQTRWFVAAMLALGVLLVGLVYRLRVGQISRRMSARFDERLAERTRVARELHDTLLQTVQGSKMVADHALKNSADHARVVRAMEQLSAWLAQATEEGRAALHSLRGATTEKNDLTEAFRRAVDEWGAAGRAEISFSVSGNPREMHPVVRDEIYRIGYEAIRNSCTHSGADRLTVTLEYAHDLTLRVGDNGVGIDSEVVEKGREGHFGLRGMRERAERIGSKFTLFSSPDAGTVITLVVPGRIAFNTAPPIDRGA
ncbi:MAG TPA: two-component regulator propeller domain-containing protein [Pyrinomonadaceae bacterium]|jgi:ligand-binding sensor domain-containing protein/two-component sensor histidine kinase|nr:two-component regulator propeller domain-containing protein [Pyrinomonadaceae bacterium]